VVELGPGDSVATGGAAALSGTDRYVGLDVRRRTPVPVDGAYANLRPALDSYAFPDATLGTAGLEAGTNHRRIAALHRDIAALAVGGEGGEVVRYLAVEPEEVVGVPDAALRPRFWSLPEQERRTRAAFIVLRKPA
jgi:hypothetical protein